jgi:hypothetical protein
MVLYAWCRVCTFSLHREFTDMILGDERLLLHGWFCHSWLSGQDWGQTHTKASKNHNNVASDEWLAHVRTIVVSLRGKLTYFFLYATTELLHQRYPVIFGVLTLFCC